MFSSTQLFICGIVILVIGYLVIYGSSSTSIQEGFPFPQAPIVGGQEKEMVSVYYVRGGGWTDSNGVHQKSDSFVQGSVGQYPEFDEQGQSADETWQGGNTMILGAPVYAPANTATMTAGFGAAPEGSPNYQCTTYINNEFTDYTNYNAESGQMPRSDGSMTPTQLPTSGWRAPTAADGPLRGGPCPNLDPTPPTLEVGRQCATFDCTSNGTIANPDNVNVFCNYNTCDAEQCCSPPPTCSTFLGANNCPSGTTSKSANAVCNSSAGGAVDPWKCSNAPSGSTNPGTCWGDSAYQCDAADRQGAYNQIQSLSTAGTSGAGGTPYSDGGQQAYELYMKLCNISPCNSNACCTPNPQCSSLKGCPDKTTLTSPSQVCAGPVCSTDECCPPNPVCTSSICNAQTQVFTGAGFTCNEATCNAGECCTDRAQCNSITCDLSKYDAQPADTYCAGTTCSVSECCIPDPTCAGYNCPVGTYHPKPNQAGIKCGVNQVCATDNCCDLNPTCAGFSPCPTHEHLKETAASIRCTSATCNSTECCGWNPKCSTQICPEDDFYWSYAHIPNASDVFCNTEVCTDNQCCVQTPTGNLPKVQTYPLFTQ